MGDWFQEKLNKIESTGGLDKKLSKNVASAGDYIQADFMRIIYSKIYTKEFGLPLGEMMVSHWTMDNPCRRYSFVNMVHSCGWCLFSRKGSSCDLSSANTHSIRRMGTSFDQRNLSGPPPIPAIAIALTHISLLPSQTKLYSWAKLLQV